MARPSLRPGGIDKDVYAIVKKLEDELEEGANPRKNQATTPRLTVGFVSDAIRRSNSSLARQKKRPLEDAIERVLALRKEEVRIDQRATSDDELEAEEARMARERSAREERDATSLMNRQIAKGWGFSSGKGPRASSEGGGGGGGGGSQDGTTPRANGADGSQTPIPERQTNGEGRQPNGEPRSKKRKAETARQEAVDRTPSSSVSIRDVAGVGHVLRRLRDEVWFPLCAGEAYEKMGYRYGKGVLLHGPSGCGKTTIAHAIAGSIGAAFIPVSATSVVGGTSGESEKNIRSLFDEAISLAPCLLFIDDIDAIAGKRDSAGKGMESRIVTEITSGMDRVKRTTTLGKNVVVLAATNRPESLDQSIRRRFSVEIDVGMPNEAAREQILRSMTRSLSLADDVDFRELAKLTPGYVGSDLQHVVEDAVSLSFYGSLHQLLETAQSSRDPAEFEGLDEDQRQWLLLEDNKQASWGECRVAAEQFRKAIARVQPASKREGFSTIPDTTWADVGALEDVRKKLNMSIIGPIKNPELYAKVGIQAAAGILLWGPPGCGKTLVAKAVANESKANFISIKGPELLNKYVGESERAVRQLFARAKSSAPCILFFDEMDALAPRRDDSLHEASARVVNTLLTELDGVGDRSGIYVIGATNRPDMIDEAIRRPGRLGTSIYVGLPSPRDRVDILRTLYRNSIAKNATPLANTNTMDIDHIPEVEVDLEKVATDTRCTGFSGADLGDLMQAAAQACLERAYTQMGQGVVGIGTPPGIANGDDASIDMNPTLTLEDWEAALSKARPSVKDPRVYEEIR